MYTLAILMKFFKCSVFLTTILRYFHKTLSESRADQLLHLLMIFVNSLFKKEGHVDNSFDKSSSKTLVLI